MAAIPKPCWRCLARAAFAQNGDTNNAGAVTLTPSQVVVTAPSGNGGVNPMAVPTLSGWALALLVALVGGMGLLGRRVVVRKADGVVGCRTTLHCRGLEPRLLNKQRWCRGQGDRPLERGWPGSEDRASPCFLLGLTMLLGSLASYLAFAYAYVL